MKNLSLQIVKLIMCVVVGLLFVGCGGEAMDAKAGLEAASEGEGNPVNSADPADLWNAPNYLPQTQYYDENGATSSYRNGVRMVNQYDYDVQTNEARVHQTFLIGASGGLVFETDNVFKDITMPVMASNVSTYSVYTCVGDDCTLKAQIAANETYTFQQANVKKIMIRFPGRYYFTFQGRGFMVHTRTSYHNSQMTSLNVKEIW